MATMRIEPGDWKSFFDRFTRMHEGWQVTVELLSENLGDQIEVENLPLEGISLSEDDGRCIEIIVGGSTERHISHTIDAPREVWLKQDESGADEALEITAEDGQTLLVFRSAMPPEAVDGI